MSLTDGPCPALMTLIVALSIVFGAGSCGSGGGGGDDFGEPQPGMTSSSKVVLRWLPEENVTGYTVHWGTDPGFYVHAHDAGDPPASDGVISVVVEVLEGSHTYYFAVTSHDALGNESSFSNELALSLP